MKDVYFLFRIVTALFLYQDMCFGDLGPDT